MLRSKASKLAIFAGVCVLEMISANSAHAQFVATEWSDGKVINLGGLPGSTFSVPTSINGSGKVVGGSVVGGGYVATEWSGGSVINLGGLPGSTQSYAFGINDAGMVVGYSVVGGVEVATEWTGSSIINLGRLPGTTGSEARAINDAGQVVGASFVGNIPYATEWSKGAVIDLVGLPGTVASYADGINNSGTVVGYNNLENGAHATEWSSGTVTDLGSSLPGSTLNGFFALARAINNAGQVAGYTEFATTEYSTLYAIEWSGGGITKLDNLDPYPSNAFGINNSGEVVGSSFFDNGVLTYDATTWTGGAATDLGRGLPGSQYSEGLAINDNGTAVGVSYIPLPPPPVPEPSTWAMMLLGFAGLGFAGYRRGRSAALHAV
jgi:probable HAF family extracellular repeat protein